MKRALFFFTFFFTLQNVSSQDFKELLQQANNRGKKVLISVKLPESESFLPIPILKLDSPCLSVFGDTDCQAKLDSLFINEYFEQGSSELRAIRNELKVIDAPNHYIFDKSGSLLFRISGSKIGSSIVTDSLTKELKSIEGNERLKESINIPKGTSPWKLMDKLNYINQLGIVDRYVFHAFCDSLSHPKYSDAFVDFSIRNTALDNLQFIHHEIERTTVTNFLTAVYDSTNYEDIAQRNNFLKKVYFAFMSSLEYSKHMNDLRLGETLFSFIERLPGNNERFSLSFAVPEATLLSGLKNMRYQYYLKTGQNEKLFIAAKAIADELIESATKDSTQFEATAEGLNTLAWSFCEYKIKDRTRLSEIVRWIDKAIELSSENPAYLDTKAHLLYLNGDREEALKVQQSALDLLEKLPNDNYLKMMYNEEIKSNYEKLIKGKL